MFDFSKEILNKDNLSVENILSNVSEISLWRYYLNTDFKLKVNFPAPYRTDNNPSFNVYTNGRNRILGKDYGGYFSGDIFNYVGMIYNLNLFETCIKINHDFNLGLTYSGQDIYKITDVISNKPLTKSQIKKLDKLGETLVSNSNKIQVVVRPFTSKDLAYWNCYGISYSTLKKYDVYCAEKVFLNNILRYLHSDVNPGYVYLFRKSNHVKIYYPYQTSNRFLGNVNNYEDIQGYYQCDVKNKENNLLVLTKSLKDVMLLHEYGIDAMAIHGEKHRFHEDFIRHIKKYYSNIVSLYDRDKSGMSGARYLWKEFGIPANFINKQYRSKDISDLYLKYGPEITQEFINKIKLK